MDVASSMQHVYDKESDLLGSEHASEEKLHCEVGIHVEVLEDFSTKKS